MSRAGSFAAAMLLAGPAAYAAEPPPSNTPSSSVEADHVALHVADLDASVAFYQSAFGLAEIPAGAAGRRWLSLGGGMALHLLGDRTVPVPNDKYVHMALRTRSLEPTLAYLRSKDIRWQDWAGTEGAVATREDGVHQIFLQDPDGYWIEVNDALSSR